MKSEEIQKNLLDLKYQRHQGRAHAFFGAGMALSFSLVGSLLAMRETEVLVYPIKTTIFLITFLLLFPWIFVVPAIRKERKWRRKVVEWIKSLDKGGYFKENT